MSAITHQPPTFEAETLELDGVAVVVVRGEVDLVSAPAFERIVDEAILDDGTPRPLLVDLGDCLFMDSCGLAVLLRVRERARMAVVCPASAPPARLFEIAARNVLVRHETRADGLAALS